MQTIHVDNTYAAVENAQRRVSEHVVDEWYKRHYHFPDKGNLTFSHRLELDGSNSSKIDLPEGVLAEAYCDGDTDSWDATQRCGFQVRIYDRRVDGDDVLVVSGSIHDNPDDIMDRLRNEDSFPTNR
jgi:hypothetical protein